MGDLTAGVALPDSQFDLTGEGIVDGDDLQAWLSQAGQQAGKTGPFIAGDTTLDGSVLFDDFVNLSIGFGTGDEWHEGDFDGNGAVGFDNFVQLSNSFLSSVNPAVSSVPEPAGALLLLIGTALTGRVRRWGSH